ncbi:MAG: hypothetical protein J6C81_06725 [Muribaculaceae bacterium]|nr:hypothetical protein [Muribaculaceae bacterium]
MSLEAPTINEIIYNRAHERSVSAYTVRPNKYHRGEYVKFRFGTVIREGRVTTAMCINGLCFYHIEGEHGTWYREIYESDIINRIPHNNHGDNTEISIC